MYSSMISEWRNELLKGGGRVVGHVSNGYRSDGFKGDGQKVTGSYLKSQGKVVSMMVSDCLSLFDPVWFFRLMLPNIYTCKL